MNWIDKIIASVFDLFTVIIPGTIVTFALLLVTAPLSMSNETISELVPRFEKVLFGLAVYLCGITIFSITRLIHGWTIQKLIGIEDKHKKHNNIKLNHPEIWKSIERWYSLSYGYFGVSLSILTSYLIFLYADVLVFDLSVLVLVLVVSFVLFIQSFRFYHWIELELSLY